MSETKLIKESLLKELPDMVKSMDSYRQGTNKHLPVDIHLNEMVSEKYGVSMDQYLQTLGVNPKVDTMENIFSMPDPNLRWLVPEFIREAIFLGMRQAPFYPNVIASDQPVSSLTTIMPYVNMSDAAPARINEAETIPLGNVSFGQKSVSLYKIGKGFKVTDEVRNYVSMDVMSIFLRDFGVQLGYALDSLLINVLINGNKADGSESAPVIGVTSTASGIVYKDLLRVWIRASRLGRNFQTLIGDEDESIKLLDLPEFKQRYMGTTDAKLNLKTPVPSSADFYIHGGIPEDQVMMIDPRAAAIKLTAKQLMLESERIVSNQTQAIYASITTGFSKMYQDAALLLDGSQEFTTKGFPEYMDVDKYIGTDIE